MTVELSVLTLNLRNVLDRYAERRRLLKEEFARLAPDLAAFQEVAFLDGDAQDAMLAGHSGREYRLFDARSNRYPDFGNSLLVGLGEPADASELRLSHGRCALRSLVSLPGGFGLWFATTHLHHRGDEPEERFRQVAEIIDWMSAAPEADAMVVAGDFNALPSEPAVEAMREAGFRSAFATVHRAEPVLTRPSGIQAEGMDTEGEPGCVDYIWLAGRVTVRACTVVFNTPAAGDETLFPSDHFGLLGELRVGAAEE